MKLFSLSLILLLSPILVFADDHFEENTCPFGEVNCTGKCGRFVDTNNDGFCDHGGLVAEEGEEDHDEAWKELTVGQAAEQYEVEADALISNIESVFSAQDVTNDSVLGDLHDGQGVCMEEMMLIAEALQRGETYKRSEGVISGAMLKEMTVSEAAVAFGVNENAFSRVLGEQFSISGLRLTDRMGDLHDAKGVDMHTAKSILEGLQNGAIELNDTPPPQKRMTKAEKFKFYEISLTLIVLYILSVILKKLKILPLRTHYRIWNLLLLLTFLISGILGMLLAAGIFIRLPFSMLNWHVYAGIAMFWLTAFHIYEHRWFFVELIRKMMKQKKA